MSDPVENKNQPGGKKPALPLIFLAVLVIISGLYYLYRQSTPESSIKSESPIKRQEMVREQRSTEPIQPIDLPGRETGVDVPQSAVTEPVGTEKDADQHCQDIQGQIEVFFQDLDQAGYLQKYQVKGSTHDFFNLTIRKLFSNPPTVVRETDDLFTILGNMIHLFKVLGPQYILTIKDIIENEKEMLEPTMALLYDWSIIGNECGRDQTEMLEALPLPNLYEYSAYFLNTLGGQSYLYRRPPLIRTLIRYYAVLIIDRANDLGINRYGIDLRFPIDSLTAEMEGIQNLVSQSSYLENLYSLQEKYRAVYGSHQK